MPHDFGVEAHLNITIAMAGGTCSVRHLGVIASRFRHKPAMGREIARAVLDLAVGHGRLDPRQYAAWRAWVDEGVAAISDIDAAGGRSQALACLFAAVRRPMPAP